MRTLVLYCLAEFQLGHARRITVIVTGRSFRVEDDGRGHAIDRTVDGMPYLKFIYGHLQYPFGAAEGGTIQLQGLGMSLLNRLCSELTVVVTKKMTSLRLTFSNGELVGQEFNEAGSTSTGNAIAGTVDARLEGKAVDEQQLQAWLCALVSASPGLKLSFNGQELQG